MEWLNSFFRGDTYSVVILIIIIISIFIYAVCRAHIKHIKRLKKIEDCYIIEQNNTKHDN